MGTPSSESESESKSEKSYDVKYRFSGRIPKVRSTLLFCMLAEPASGFDSESERGPDRESKLDGAAVSRSSGPLLITRS